MQAIMYTIDSSSWRSSQPAATWKPECIVFVVGGFSLLLVNCLSRVPDVAGVFPEPVKGESRQDFLKKMM